MRWRGMKGGKKLKAELPAPVYRENPVVTGALFLPEPVPLRFKDIFKCASETETVWRMKGYLDCLRAMNEYGPPDPKFVEYLVEKTGEKAP